MDVKVNVSTDIKRQRIIVKNELITGKKVEFTYSMDIEMANSLMHLISDAIGILIESQVANIPEKVMQLSQSNKEDIQ